MKNKFVFLLNVLLAINVYAQNSLSINLMNYKNFDLTTKPQDDFYQYVNGNWIKHTQIPEDKSSWGAFFELREETMYKLHKIVLHLQSKKNLSDAEKQLIAMYDSYMNLQVLNKLDNKPLLPILNKIDSMTDIKDLPEIIAYFNRIGVNAPYDFAVDQDSLDSNTMVVNIGQSGLGLPDRDYYFTSNDIHIIEIQKKYQMYITKMLLLSNISSATNDAKEIFDLEKQIANIQWSRVENRDPIKTYNKIAIDKLKDLMPAYNWNQYLYATNLASRINYVIVNQPSYFTKLNDLIKKVPLSTWKLYFKWQVINSYASILSSKYEEASFAFYGKELRGVLKHTVRWKRGISLLDQTLGFNLGKIYVDTYFSEADKEHIKLLVSNLINEYRISINNLDWMSQSTKKHAIVKLNAMTLKLGYPDKWRTYTNLIIKNNDLFGNIIRSNEYQYMYNLNKLGKPIDKTEWEMTPQTVNAYYNLALNEIVFPAAILQPPFFYSKETNNDAFNYGAIGAVIGHEISHAFDDEGSQYDEKGNLHNWWTKSDKEKFNLKTLALVKQYDKFSPVKGYFVNGKLTLGENIADNAGLTIAYRAYMKLLNANSITNEQSFFISWAQIWRNKTREQQLLMNLKTDVHSPSMFRCNGVLMNLDGFYHAFNLKEGDKMFINSTERVKIW